MQKIEPCYYSDYLQLDKILDAHSPMSTKYKGKVAHDENLFIIIHQTYELWFKQILIEVNSVRGFFNSSVVKDTDLHTMVSRLDRVVEILNILVDQIKIIETMTPMDFMDFRDFLLPASGFQSVQFRQIEIALGLKLEDRTSVEKGFFNSRLNDTDRKRLNDDGKKDSLFTLVQSWLERMPFSTFKTFNFWEEYKSAVAEMLESDLKIIQNNKTLTETQLKFEEANFKLTKSSFDTLFDEKLHNELLVLRKKKLSLAATRSALFIQIFRSEPVLNLPYQLIKKIVEIDEVITKWRYSHAMMAQRILGTKIGTGGSSGNEYLKKTTESSRIFLDYFNLPSFLIPNGLIPELPKDLKQKLGFIYQK